MRSLQQSEYIFVDRTPNGETENESDDFEPADLWKGLTFLEALELAKNTRADNGSGLVTFYFLLI